MIVVLTWLKFLLWLLQKSTIFRNTLRRSKSACLTKMSETSRSISFYSCGQFKYRKSLINKHFIHVFLSKIALHIRNKKKKSQELATFFFFLSSHKKTSWRSKVTSFCIIMMHTNYVILLESIHQPFNDVTNKVVRLVV